MLFRILPLFVLLWPLLCIRAEAADFRADWSEVADRVWAGPDFWANRLQDWRVRGRLECIEKSPAKPMRTVHLLTRYLTPSEGGFDLSVQTGLIDEGEAAADAASGFLIGAAPDVDYRAAALVHHSPGPGGGLFAGVDGRGEVFIRDFSHPDQPDLARSQSSVGTPREVRLQVELRVSGEGRALTITATSEEGGSASATLADTAELAGGLALVSHPGTGEDSGRFWFQDWRVTGSQVAEAAERRSGPILSAQHTLDAGVLKMTAQLMPIGETDSRDVLLQTESESGWRTVATASVISPGWTATFRVPGWESKLDHRYRISYLSKVPGESSAFEGTVRRDPVDKPVLVLAGFTGNHNLRNGVERAPFDWNREAIWFPHNDIVGVVRHHRPDVLFFSGDQVYEGASPSAPDRSGNYSSFLDYMYKWYLWCWAYRDLTRDTVAVTIPDDHDVYQGNLWGENGRPADRDHNGGYIMPADFVRMVERTQTSHLPAPFDATPIEQGIGVYYTDLTYGRISFAILEDRKFKTGCAGRVPPTTSGRPDHVVDPSFDPSTVDVAGAALLGDRQLAFLRHWAADWRGADMKASLSQTVFAGLATHHGANLQYLVADLDSNGWPQAGRNRALSELRKAFAFMVGGDQHLATVAHHGVDDWNDSGWSFTVPSVANFYPRAWLPPTPGRNRAPGAPEFTGEHLDGLGNKVTVFAATNPQPMGHEPPALHDRMPGYGIVRFDKTDRTILIENWPRFADPAQAEAPQYEGWPIRIDQLDNYARRAAAFLPRLEFSGIENPVVQVVNQATGEIVYTLRIQGRSFQPKVFDATARHTLIVGEPEIDRLKTLSDLEPGPEGSGRRLEIVFD